MGIIEPQMIEVTVELATEEDVEYMHHDALEELPHIGQLDIQGQVYKDYGDVFSLQDSTYVTHKEEAHSLGPKRKQKRNHGHHASLKQKTYRDLTAKELQQLRPNTKYNKHVPPNRNPQLYEWIKRAEINGINVKMKNYKFLLNLIRLLFHYII